MATKHTGAYPKPKSFSGKLHQTLSYRAQGRAFPLVRNTTHNACMRYRRGHPYIVSWAIPTAYHVQDRNHCLVQDEGQRP
jgi:hypothetical protein